MNIPTLSAAILTGGFIFVGSSTALPVELITNGGFEVNNGFLGPAEGPWTGNNNNLGWVQVSGTNILGFNVYSHNTQVFYAGDAPAGGGDFYFHTVGLGGIDDSGTTVTTFDDVPAVVEQTVDVSSRQGQNYELSAYIAGHIGPAVTIALDTAIIELEFLDLGGASLGIASTLDGTTGGTDGVTNTWDLFAAQGVIPLGADQAVVRINQAAIPQVTAGLQINGNDNYVDQVSLTVPEPASLSLLGLGGLLLSRRRLR